MDIDTTIDVLLALFRQSGSLAFVLYAAVTCVITEIAKKLFIPKLKIDLLNKFDPTRVMPFVAAACCAVFNSLVFVQADLSSLEAWRLIAVESISIGATSTVFYHVVKSLFGESLKKLCKDEIFNLFYTQLFLYSNIKQELLEKKTTLKAFISQVKVVSEKAGAIYEGTADENEKRQQLDLLLRGILADDMIIKTLTPIHNAMMNMLPVTEDAAVSDAQA